ncbi:hypothetical protein LIN78_12110 [Leeia sp. TBRC 13508]|uniref:Uncharacterized protein n=1 Tax=Leeia speluncae TaxID=2884804 RepID=A0ABS8D7V2_9NEIS|nr:hypothetical protein [Leeia speluncae]MCB6184289.1 hypothetical protein [Leeia speluncae]
MSLQTQVNNLALRIATECKSLKVSVGPLSSLSTTDKSSLVAAINELFTVFGSATQILDSAAAGDTSHTWSANKIISEINAAKNAIINGAPEALDTLLEIASQLANDQSALSSLLTAVGNRVRFDDAQGLNATQQQQARDNIGAVSVADVGDVNADFVATFEAGLL